MRYRAKISIAGGLMLLATSGCTTGLNASARSTPECPHLSPARSGPANASYLVEGDAITLADGWAAREAAPGSAERIETRLFGMPAWGDLDGDGDEDAAVILLQRTGGTGSFYYVAAAIRHGCAFSGTNAVRLGDRVAPQSIRVRNGFVIATYADRRAGEPMAAVPSVAKTKHFALQAGKLVETEPQTGGR